MKPLVESFLRERRLELSAEETHITRIEDGFDFLGENVRDYGGTILVKPSRKNVAKFLGKVRGIIKASRHVTAGHLIVNLNLVVRGWANYHRHVASKRTFSRVDHAIFRALWQWAKRRHPKKSRRWIKDRYFETIDRRHWVFHGTVAGREEVIQPVWLLAASSVPIQRHTKVKGEANPYDPAWEPHFEERLGVKMAGTLVGPMDSAAALEGARRYLSGLQPEDHHGDGVAQPPYRVANPWEQGYDREPRAGASELPSTDPQPRVRCGKAASCEGRSRGLSCMNGDIHVQFLGERVAATSPPYPTPGWATTQAYLAQEPLCCFLGRP